MSRKAGKYGIPFPENLVAGYKFCEFCGTGFVTDTIEDRGIKFNQRTGAPIRTLFWGCPSYSTDEIGRKHTHYLFYRETKNA